MHMVQAPCIFIRLMSSQATALLFLNREGTTSTRVQLFALPHILHYKYDIPIPTIVKPKTFTDNIRSQADRRNFRKNGIPYSGVSSTNLEIGIFKDIGIRRLLPDYRNFNAIQSSKIRTSSGEFHTFLSGIFDYPSTQISSLLKRIHLLWPPTHIFRTLNMRHMEDEVESIGKEKCQK